MASSLWICKHDFSAIVDFPLSRKAEKIKTDFESKNAADGKRISENILGGKFRKRFAASSQKISTRPDDSV